jgi:LmeA-like phospholipid-binding
MQFLTIFLASFLSIFVTSGLFVESAIEKNLREKVKNVDTLEVRIDNKPSYQLLNGKIDKLRIASRGLKITDYLTIDTLELETDNLNLNLKNIQAKNNQNWRQYFNQPFQGGINLTISESELNQTLQSETVLKSINKIIANLSKGRGGTSGLKYELLNPQIKFQDDHHLIFSGELLSSSSRILKINFDSKLRLVKGYQIELTEIKGTINDKPLSEQLLNRISGGLTNVLDLRNAEKRGVILRLLKLNIKDEKINLTAFIRINN